MLTIFYATIIGHLIADFVLQGSEIATQKRMFNKYMLVHVVSAALLFLLPVFLVTGNFEFKAMTLIFILHLIIDVIKKEIDPIITKGKQNRFFILLGVDQMLHITSLFWVLRWL